MLLVGVVLTFFVAVGLVLYFKPGSTAEPSGEPSLDVFGAGPILDFEPGSISQFEKEHFFLVRLETGGVIALYEMGPLVQKRIAAGDLDALKCQPVLRQDDEMAGWLAAAGAPPGFETRGIWDACTGVAWDATGKQVYGPESGDLDRFPVEITDGIMRVDLGNRQCSNPVTPDTPCIVTQ
jgi:hypothetical protein